MFKILLPLLVAAPLLADSFDPARPFLKQYCQTCHSGARPTAGLNVEQIKLDAWTRIANRVRNSEMPPRGAVAPPLTERTAFLRNLDGALHAQTCAAGRSLAKRGTSNVPVSAGHLHFFQSLERPRNLAAAGAPVDGQQLLDRVHRQGARE
jgi:hypothetical protein